LVETEVETGVKVPVPPLQVPPVAFVTVPLRATVGLDLHIVKFGPAFTEIGRVY
jgi:hypothetical protein